MDIDINTLRSAVTVAGLLLFLGIVWWTYDRSRRSGFDEAARLPFVEPEDAGATPELQNAGRPS